mmetsp:Transcript_29874/g.84163  ORF Transcript_29874/g.84163 Transcript_29874/m.84163 type:complete len:393 (-) Transcript_29874:131-1309(-)
MMLLAAVPVLVQGFQLSQAVMLDGGKTAPGHRMGHTRPLFRKRPLVRMARALMNDLKDEISAAMPTAASSVSGRAFREFSPPSESPVEQFEHIGAKIEAVLPNLKTMHEAQDTGVRWMSNTSDLVAALTDLKKMFDCYQGTDYIGSVLETAKTLKEQAVISDVKKRADAVNLLFRRLGKLSLKYEKLVPILEEQGFMLDIVSKFFVIENEMQKGDANNWRDPVLQTADEAMQSVGEQDLAAKRSEFKAATLEAATEIETAVKVPKPDEPTEAKHKGAPAPVPEEPVEPTKPSEPQKWTYTSDESYAAAFAEYQATLSAYEGDKHQWYMTLADWAKQKELETIWALYDTDVAMYESQATKVKKDVNDLLTVLVPKVIKCPLHSEETLALLTNW